MFGSIYYKSGPVIDRHILSHSIAGTMSIFVLVQQLLSMINLILTKAIVVPQITVMNKVTREGDDKLIKWIKKKVFLLLFIAIILFFLVLLIGEPLMNISFEIFNLTKFNSHVIWLLTIALFGTFVGDFTATLLSSAFYSKGDTKTPSLLSIVTYTIFIPLKFISFYFSLIF
ncbi:hypothetical protein B4907_21995 [Yersinia kristensenii]|nr:hypothetical protein B4907_21995 [Yersinia kristensenii]